MPHWHANAVEVGVVLNGVMRITIWEGDKEAHEFTVPRGAAWMIPQGALHCLENVSEESLDFLVSYNNSHAEDRDFSTAWSALPETLLAQSLDLAPEMLSGLKKHAHNRLSLYDPGDSVISQDIPSRYRAVFNDVTPIYQSSLGVIRRLDKTNWNANQFMALQQTILQPGTIREPHWYRGSDALLFVHKGHAYFNMMDGEGNVYNLKLGRGDLVFIPNGAFHTYVNIGDQELEIYESFIDSEPFSEIGFQEATTHFRPGVIAGAMGLDLHVVQQISKTTGPIYMRSL